MDSEAQAAGAKRVRQMLVEPLLRRGLAKPGSLIRAEFEAMLDDLCARLAYMNADDLAALEEQAAANPSGKDGDRFPIANRILEWAGQIAPPPDGASPLIRAVFAHQLGQDAIAEGWAPELLGELRRNRRWPTPFLVKAIRERADGPTRQLRDIEWRLSRGEDVPREQADWRDRRVAAMVKCREISETARKAQASSGGML